MTGKTQLERLTLAGNLLDSVEAELAAGEADDSTGALQVAVYCQTGINRIVWMLNKRMEEE